MDKNALMHLIDVASGRTAADLCLKNCKVVDVLNKEIFESNVYISNGYIAGFGSLDFPEAKQTIDVKGRYLAPGFIDGHLHIESSHLSPEEYAKLVVPCGTTTVIADPHEIVNVCGLDGMDYMLEATENLPMTVFLQFPSCVPATPFENSGAILKAEDIAKRINHPRVLGLGELMNYVGVFNNDSDIIDKILLAKKENKIIDGHSPSASGCTLDAYSLCGVRNDHECTSVEELKNRIRRGMYVLLRQGTVCHDLVNLLKGVDYRNMNRCLMCTDDCQAKTILEIGHIDNNVRMAINEGIEPITAIAMATINAAECFNLKDRGLIAPGYRADFVLFKNLNDIRIDDVFVSGKLVASNKKILVDIPQTSIDKVSGRMNIANFSKDRLKLHLESNKVRTIKINSGSIISKENIDIVSLDSENNWIRNNYDIVKVAVIERHNGTGNVGLALLKDFGLKGGAVATTVAHDSHNLIVAGDNDDDMVLAVNSLEKIGGGMVVVKNGKVLETVKHEIAGLMTAEKGEVVAQMLSSIQNTARKELGIHDGIDPFMTLCFMSLPVIPELKLTDLGLFDVRQFSFVSLEV